MTRRTAALIAVWILPSATFLALVAGLYRTWRIEVPPRLSAEGRRAIIAPLQAALDGIPAGELADLPELRRALDRRGPVAASIFVDGKRIARLDGYGATVGEATLAATGLVARDPAVMKLGADERRKARIKVDVVVGRGPIELDHSILQLVAVHPGLDGVGIEVDTPDGPVQHLLMPDEMFLEGLLAKKPLSKIMPDVAMGLDVARTDAVLAGRARIPQAKWKTLSRRYYRFRTDAFVTSDEGVLPLVRGLPLGPLPTADNLRAAALAGARYLVSHLGSKGRYVYEQNLTTGKATDPAKPGPYSLPRHAGTTYFLAEVYRHTREEWLREPIERAFAHLRELVDAGGCRGTLPDGTAFACVIDRGGKTAGLGSTALGVVALVEYQRATGDRRYLELATHLSSWILWMQRPDGSFRHLYDVQGNVADDKAMLLYYSGEAALAMARMYAITGEERYARSAERALDWLVGWYDFFVGGFLYGEDHWTCIASEALWPRVKKPKYLDFCTGLARFWGAMQPAVGDHPSQPDLVGSHGVTPFVMPQNTPAGSHSEARISTYELGRGHGRPDPVLRREILETLGYLLRQQIRPANAFAVAAAANGLGGVAGNPVDRTVRIDYVQHVGSAFLRGVALAEEEAGAGAISVVEPSGS